MPSERSKALEIKRLTTPLTFENSKGHDSWGNVVDCVETIDEVRYIIEPKEGILSDDEILKYAPKSKAASEVRLKKGIGNFSDALLIHQTFVWAIALYYVILVCFGIIEMVTANKFGLLIIMVLAVIPLIYMYRIFNLNNYAGNQGKETAKVSEDKKPEVHIDETVNQSMGVESLKKYGKEIENLEVLFNIKEEVVRDLIEKRFAPPQITYDKFISIIDSSHKLFYNQSESAKNIINLAAEDTPRVQDEIHSKIDAMHKIIDYIEKLTNELVINISNETGSDEEVKGLLDDMENLIDSVKEY